MTEAADIGPDGVLRSVDAVTGEAFGDGYAVDGPADVAAACEAAEHAFEACRSISRLARAEFLETISAEILAIGDELIATVMRESGLPRARLEGERGRTVGQLRLFADLLRGGDHLGIRVDPALPERLPMPRPDIRLRMIPLGPVAVFGASNFPLAFSTAGGDTASALAAGCPVIVKAHPAHPATGVLIAAAIRRAVASCGMPAGVFGHLVGAGNDLGAALVQDPRIAAVGFTGSRSGGLALLRLAQARPVPIPVYAEMSSINPVVLCPAALKARGAALGTGFVHSLTMGAGQFCTNPGLLLAIEGEGLGAFIDASRKALDETAAAPMLTGAIRGAYESGVRSLATQAGVELLARGQIGDGGSHASAVLFATDAQHFLDNDALCLEVFGAASLLVRCRDSEMLLRVLRGIEGQLTATIQMDEGDMEFAAGLIPILERKVGRILANGWPTGVEVTHAMVHGGPYPATSDARTTSVGSLAIDRFLRPVAYQNLTPALLPPELRDDARGDTPWLFDGKCA